MIRLSAFFFILFSSFAIFGPLMPLYLKHQGLNTEQIGNILAFGAIIAIIGQPFFGYISDRIQSTKKVLIFVMVMSLSISFLYFSVHSFILISLLFVCLNFFQSSSGPLIENITISYSQANKKNYGLIRLWGDIGVGTASVFIGLLIGLFGMDKLGLMYTAIVVTGIMVALSLKDERKKSIVPISIKAIKDLFMIKEYVWFLLLALFIFTTHRMNDSMLSIHLSDLGATDSQVGFAWMIATFACTPLFIVMGKLVMIYKEMVLILIGALLYTIRWFLYSLTDSTTILLLLQLMHGITFPVFIVASLFLVTKIVPKEVVATGQTVYIAVIVGIGGMIGSGGGGWFMGRFGAQATYQVGTLITFIGVLLCAGTLLYEKRKRKMVLDTTLSIKQNH